MFGDISSQATGLCGICSVCNPESTLPSDRCPSECGTTKPEHGAWQKL